MCVRARLTDTPVTGLGGDLCFRRPLNPRQRGVSGYRQERLFHDSTTPPNAHRLPKDPVPTKGTLISDD